MTAPLVNLRPYQLPVFWRDDLRLMALCWSRQKGKSHTLASKQLRRMMENPGLLCVYASASLNMGREIVEKNAQVFFGALNKFRAACQANAQQLTFTADAGTYDDFVDVFEKQALEVKIWHDKTTFSRTKVIAPNPATARGWSGDVYIDEFGWIADLRGVWDAMEPIMSSDPSFRCVMATTPPEDDAHFSYELLIPGQESFPVHPQGNWYKSKAGIWTHRVDAWDAHAAGVSLYDMETGLPLTPEQHRAQSLDKDSWDRNYALKFLAGGTSAISLLALATAQAKGPGKAVAAQDDLPAGWAAALGTGTIGIGYDVATTEKNKSNPSALVVTERLGNEHIARLVFRWKTANPATSRRLVREVIWAIHAAGKRPRRLAIDGTNERYYATDLQRELRGILPVEVVIGSETVEHRGETFTKKDYLGNLAANSIEDANSVLPPDKWVENDFRLVKKRKGHFDNDLDSSGNHADTFDAYKLSLHAIASGTTGPASATPCGPGGKIQMDRRGPIKTQTCYA